MVQIAFPVVRALKIPGTVSCGRLSFGQNLQTQGLASGGRLAERHTDGGFQPLVQKKEQAAP